jgi:hypothetical protein
MDRCWRLEGRIVVLLAVGVLLRYKTSIEKQYVGGSTYTKYPREIGGLRTLRVVNSTATTYNREGNE